MIDQWEHFMQMSSEKHKLYYSELSSQSVSQQTLSRHSHSGYYPTPSRSDVQYDFRRNQWREFFRKVIIIIIIFIVLFFTLLLGGFFLIVAVTPLRVNFTVNCF